MGAWPTVQSKSETIRGIGQCKWTTGNDLKVKLDDQDAVITVTKDKLPAYLFENGKGKPAVTKIKMNFTLNGKKDTVYSAYPAKGEFIVKFEGWNLKKDEKQASPQRVTGPRTSKDGAKYNVDYQMMVANLHIQEGDFKDMVIPYILRYLFVEIDQEGRKVAAIKTSSKSNYGVELLEFMDVTGLNDEADLPAWSDNVLPFLQKRMLEKDRTFKIIMKNGWVETVLGQDEVDLNPDVDFDEADDKMGEDAPDQGDK